MAGEKVLTSMVIASIVLTMGLPRAFSVLESLESGYERLEGETDAQVEGRMVEAARQANIHEFVSGDCPKGYETKCGERGVQMSGGQKQRIAIARALVRNPRVLLLDEATSAMDSETEYLIRQAFQRYSVGRTVLVIAHRLATAASADRILVLDKGKLVQVSDRSGFKGRIMVSGCLFQSGSHMELLKDEHGPYYRMVKLQELFPEAPKKKGK